MAKRLQTRDHHMGRGFHQNDVLLSEEEGVR